MEKHMKKRIVIISVISLVVLMIVGLLIYYLINREEIIEASNPMKTNLLVPNIAAEEFTYNLSITEETIENVIFSITSKQQDYPIYYVVMEMDENGNIEDIKDEDYFLYENEITIERNSYIYLKYKDGEIYSNIPYKIEIKNIISSEEDEAMTEEELEAAKLKEEEKNTDLPYYIKVNYGANVVTIYTKDANNEYTVPVKAMVCSTGTATPTSGVYKTTNKYVWRQLIGGVYGQYATRIVGSILFHSVPYLSNKKDTLEYWEYDKLGTRASAGCIRLTVADAKWIYNNCASGTMVEFYSSSNPGPLGKPSSQKISQYTNVRNWDPTDPDSNNPWLYSNLEQEKPPENNNQETQQPTVTPNPEPNPEPNPTPDPTPDSTPTPDPGTEGGSEGEEGDNSNPDDEQGGNEGTEGDLEPEPTPTPDPEPEPTPDLEPEPTPEPTPEQGTDNVSEEGNEDIETN